MRPTLSILCLFIMLPTVAQQPTSNDIDHASVELLEFLAEFNLQSENAAKDYDLIRYHALQDLKKQPLESDNER